MLAHAVSTLGGIDVALLAHGVLGEQPVAEMDYATAEAILRTNFLSPVSLVTWLANYFEAERRGTIAVVSSVAGDRGRKSNYVYGASKGGLSIFLDGVRNRIDRAGVQVLTIKPGFVATPMTAHLKKNALFAEPSRVGKDIVRAIEKRKDVVYTPPFWGLIMLVVRSVPAADFQAHEYVGNAPHGRKTCIWTRADRTSMNHRRCGRPKSFSPVRSSPYVERFSRSKFFPYR